MNIGRMRHRIVFLKPNERTENALNEDVPVWVPYHPGKKLQGASADLESNTMKKFMVWADVAPASGREYEEAQKLRPETTYNVVTRYFPDIDERMKILHNGKTLEIISVLNIGCRNEQLKIVAKDSEYYGKE